MQEMGTRRVVRPRGGPVSCLVMHLPVKLSATLAAVIAVSVCGGFRTQAQDSSPQSSPSQSSSAQGQQAQAPDYGVYVSVDPLAKVRYNNR